MCIIVDNSVRDIVFGEKMTVSGERLRNMINDQQRKLVVGGKLVRELSEAESFKNWLVQAQLADLVIEFPDSDVDALAEWVKHESKCRSNDEHVIALALLSGCRVLCARDRKLREDFRDPEIVRKPRGKLYSIDQRANGRLQYENLLKWTRSCKGCG